MDNMNRKVVKLGTASLAVTAVCLTLISLNAVAQQGTEANERWANALVVEIEFSEKRCPKSVNKDDFTATKARAIIWKSVPNIENFSIYFDPFSNRRNDSKDGELRRRFARDAPPRDDSANPDAEIVYKYTIVGNDCKGDALDPRFRLRR